MIVHYTLVSDKSPRKDKTVGEPICFDYTSNPDEVVDAFVKRFLDAGTKVYQSQVDKNWLKGDPSSPRITMIIYLAYWRVYDDDAQWVTGEKYEIVPLTNV